MSAMPSTFTITRLNTNGELLWQGIMTVFPELPRPLRGHLLSINGKVKWLQNENLTQHSWDFSAIPARNTAAIALCLAKLARNQRIIKSTFSLTQIDKFV